MRDSLRPAVERRGTARPPADDDGLRPHGVSRTRRERDGLTGRLRHDHLLARENHASNPGRVFDALAGLGRDAIEACQAQGLTPVATTIGAPGLVDVETGTLVFAPSLGWDEVRLATELKVRLGRLTLHTMADNEASRGG